MAACSTTATEVASLTNTHSHGLAWGWLTIMVITLGVFALVYGMLYDPVMSLLDIGADYSTSAQAAEGRTYARDAWRWMPFVVLTAAALALMARAIAESARVQ